MFVFSIKAFRGYTTAVSGSWRPDLTFCDRLNGKNSGSLARKFCLECTCSRIICGDEERVQRRTVASNKDPCLVINVTYRGHR